MQPSQGGRGGRRTPRPRVRPLVTLGSLRKSHGDTSRTLAPKIARKADEMGAPGFTVHPDSILMVENGHSGPSYELMRFWLAVYGLAPEDVYTEAEVRAMVAESDEETARREGGGRVAALPAGDGSESRGRQKVA